MSDNSLEGLCQNKPCYLKKYFVLGVLGDPIAHSLSPAMHSLLAEKTDIKLYYSPFLVKKESFAKAVCGAAALGIDGLNVTSPHKEAAFSLCDNLSEEARLVGAVNTLSFIEGRIHGHNTDIEGVSKALEINGVKLNNCSAVILGAGGAAKAAAAALCKNNAQKITILNRTPEKAQVIANILHRHYKTKIDILGLDELSKAPLGDILIQTTTLGMGSSNKNPVSDPNILKKYSSAMDMIYSPWETPFLALARDCGLNAFNGFDMLLRQGIAAFELWTGQIISQKIAAEVSLEIRQKYNLDFNNTTVKNI